MTAIEKARQATRKAIEKSHYDGTCTVTEHKKITDTKTRISGYQDVITLRDQPCHLIFKTVNSARKSEQASAIEQATKLLISPDVTIKPGSKITVTQAGITVDYTYSGAPAFYPTHQEIMLDLFERWA